MFTEVHSNWSPFATSLECGQVRHGLSYCVVFREALLPTLFTLQNTPPPVDRQPVTPSLKIPVVDANDKSTSEQMTCLRHESLVKASDHTFMLPLNPWCFLMQSVLNFQANRGEQYQELYKKGCNEGTIYNGWGTMLGDVLQNYFPN